MRRLGLLTVLAISLLLYVVACSEQEGREAGMTSKESQEATETETNGEKGKYQKEVENELNELGDRIDELGAKAEGTGKEVKAEISKLIDEVELEKKKEAAAKKLEKLESASEEAWGDVKSEMDAAVDELEEAYDRVVAYFEKQ